MKANAPNQLSWQIYNQMINGAKVYDLAKKYTLRQEQVIKLYFECTDWIRNTTMGNYSRRPRR